MSQVYILVEGQTDAEILRRILPNEAQAHATFINSQGVAGMSSLARSIMVMRKKPVIVVMDADSTNQHLVKERKEGTEEFIRAADASVPAKVVTIVPQMEVLFFAAPDLIARVLGNPVPKEWLSAGKRDPKGVLQQLAEMSSAKWDSRQAIALLDAVDVDKIRAVPEVREIISFLENLQQDGKAA